MSEEATVVFTAHKPNAGESGSVETIYIVLPNGMVFICVKFYCPVIS